MGLSAFTFAIHCWLYGVEVVAMEFVILAQLYYLGYFQVLPFAFHYLYFIIMPMPEKYTFAWKSWYFGEVCLKFCQSPPIQVWVIIFLIIKIKMSLVKNNNNSGSLAVKKNLNFTAQVADVIMSITKKSAWKDKTGTKLIKTLNNQPNHSNIMTEDDIDKLFGRCGNYEKAAGPTKVSTEVAETWGIGGKNFTKSVKFLRMEDQTDKFLTGLPDEEEADEDKIDRLFTRVNDAHQVDLTTTFKKNYLVGNIIGQGAYASVRVAIYKPQDKKIAIKVYQKVKIKDSQRKKSVRREIKILSLLNHPNIVKILDVVETNNHLNIVMEYLSGTSLGAYLKSQANGKISQKNCKKIFKALVRALRYMHSMNIAHRDIKLENIILDEQLSPKIIDFGFSTCIEPEKKIKIFCGTPSYMAPQVVQKKEYRGQNADIWALGVMLFVCLTGLFPFKGATDQELYRKINNSQYPKGELLFSRPLSDLMSKMLKICPEQRITASEILKHSWFTENRSDSSKKKNTDSSLDNRKRINTLTSNGSKDNKWAHKTGVVKKVLLETNCNENMRIQIKMALKSPKVQQDINSYRMNDKENTIKFLKSEKNTHRGKQNSDIKDKDKQKSNKTHSKVIDLLKMEMKKREQEKSKNKRKL